MTVLGKILVFANLVFGLLVCGLIVVVYVARTNWKTGYDEYKNNYNVLNSRFATLKEEMATEQRKGQEEATRLQGEVDKATKAAEAEHNAHEATKRAFADESKKGVGESSSVQQLKADIDRRNAEVKTLEDAVKGKDEQINKMVQASNKLRDERVAAVIKANSLDQRVNQLVAQLEATTKENVRLRRSGGSVAGSTVSSENPPPQNVEGLIKQVDPSGLVTLSIGSDAGLARGHTLDVFRLSPAQYLGQIRLTDVRANEAVGRPVGRMKGPVQVGDRVASNVSTKG
jgi:hypothetical protein